MADPKQNSGRAGSGRREAAWGEASDWLDDWIAIEPDGTITAFSGKVELGTGVRTALAQIVAEELDVPLEQVHMVIGDTARTPNEGYTAGSMTISGSGTALRRAAAEARHTMLEIAAERLDAEVGELSVSEGAISVNGDPPRSVTYAELMGGKLFNLQVTDEAPLKSPDTYRIVGRSTPRLDLPHKVTGQPSFIHDLQVPGMVHARLVRPPSPAAQLVSMDEKSVKDIPGLIKVVQRGNFIGVLAEREEQAIRAAQQLKVEWQETAAYPNIQDLYSTLRSQPTQDNVVIEQGDFEHAFIGIADAVQQVHASYTHPYHAHASMGPSCAVAEVVDDQVTVWASTPGPYPLSGALAQLLNLPAENVHVIHVEGAGAYGQNGSDDAAADAVILAQAVGRAVRVQWTRKDEFVWEPKSPAMVMEVHGGLDSQGNVVAWDYHVWSPSHTNRPRVANQLIAAQLLNRQPAPPSRFSFGAERNAPTNYAFPAQRVTVHYLRDSFLHVSSFRTLGGMQNTFANESFMDELAAAAGVDPLEYRLRYLTDPREREVLEAGAEKANWESRPSPRKDTSSVPEGRGVAFARYENNQAIVACIAEVQVERASGMVRVKRIVVAHDCGLIINPDGVKNQIEGNVIQALSRALKEEVQFDELRITSVDWQTYPILTFSEVPEIEIVLINRADQPALGAGEPATVTTAAAVANAVFDATGVRLRQIPFTPERVRAALIDHQAKKINRS